MIDDVRGGVHVVVSEIRTQSVFCFFLIQLMIRFLWEIPRQLLRPLLSCYFISLTYFSSFGIQGSKYVHVFLVVRQNVFSFSGFPFLSLEEITWCPKLHDEDNFFVILKSENLSDRINSQCYKLVVLDFSDDWILKKSIVESSFVTESEVLPIRVKLYCRKVSDAILTGAWIRLTFC